VATSTRMPAGTVIMPPPPSRRAAPSPASRHQIPGATRTVAAPITISIIAAPGVRQGAIGPAALGSVVSTTTGANPEPLAPLPSSVRSRATARCRASRLHPNSCCGVTPCRRATAEKPA
jgi:hypothetical protein